MSACEVSVKQLCEISAANAKLDDKTLSDFITQSIQEECKLNDEEAEIFKVKLLRYFIPNFRKNWKSSCYRSDVFKDRNNAWLSTYFTVNLNKPSKDCDKEQKDFESCSKSTKRRKVQTIFDNYSTIEIQEAFLTYLRTSGRKKMASSIADLLNRKEKEEEDNIIRYTEDECLALIEDAKLSKYQYEIIRLQAKSRNADIYLTYSTLNGAKERCYPPSEYLNITEKSAAIELQGLLNHTASRLLSIPDVQTKIVSQNLKAVTLDLKYGCDGASDQSLYKQKLPEGMTSDESIFMVSMVPIQLESESKEIWKNPHPGSTKLCIPLSFQYAKETPDLTRSVINELKEKISQLVPTKISFGRFRCQVHFKMHLTMVDGKVAQNLTETSSAATCILCKANPSEMNDLNRIMLKPVNEENYEYGISPLHAKIRFMTLILNISYRLDFCKWKASSEDEKIVMKAAALKVQQRFRKEMGLIVDVPKHGAGNSNDGNTARRFFRDPELTSEITGVDVCLIKRFSIILQVISCSRKIDIQKFKSYLLQTAKLYVNLYEWYYMPSSVHKILMHGAQIVESFLIPIGLLSEEAQEARNKDFRRFREHNTRKCNRQVTNTDLMHKMLISSDPYLSYLRQEWKQSDSIIDLEALELLMEA